MKFIENGPDIPPALLRAHQNRNDVCPTNENTPPAKRHSKTKQPHYIPIRYLQAWCEARLGSLWCRRYGDKPFLSNPDSVAKTRRMYQFHPISYDEFKAMLYYLSTKPDNRVRIVLLEGLKRVARATIYSALLKGPSLDADTEKIVAHSFAIDLFGEEDRTELVSMKMQLLSVETKEAARAAFDKYIIEGQEPFMSRIEDNFNPVLSKLLAGINPGELSDAEFEFFLLYIFVQLARLPEMFGSEERFPATILGMRHFCMADWVLDHYLPVGDRLGLFQMNLLENKTSLHFITGDFPVRNLAEGGSRAKHWDLYFPISPTRAIFYSEKNRFETVYAPLRNPTREVVDKLNRTIAERCTQFLFADSEDLLSQNSYVAKWNPPPTPWPTPNEDGLLR